eukprot:TRINITY_DN1054_c0_g1_i3.p1 TRINITY_DN1054_c0_g1~~TRINITY_DN1054_c0_g1_i3.p1  ORF type:complete len:188 (+),score=19.44 TRINITY_DN1054_c0_g1_i3:96-659(+)
MGNNLCWDERIGGTDVHGSTDTQVTVVALSPNATHAWAVASTNSYDTMVSDIMYFHTMLSVCYGKDCGHGHCVEEEGVASCECDTTWHDTNCSESTDDGVNFSLGVIAVPVVVVVGAVGHGGDGGGGPRNGEAQAHPHQALSRAPQLNEILYSENCVTCRPCDCSGNRGYIREGHPEWKLGHRAVKR